MRLMEQATQVRLAVTSTLLATSGVLTVAESAQRWWPACHIGAFDSGGCLDVQDHAYDYIVPGDPWTPLGRAAELHGTGMLLLAAAVLLLPGVLNGHWPGRKLTLAAIVVSTGVALAALPTLLSGLQGTVVSPPGMWLPAVLYLLGLPALLLVSVAPASPAPRRVWLARWAVVTCLVVANNVLILHLMVAVILMYSSYDTTPWAEAVGGVLLIATSVFLWLAIPRNPVLTRS